MRRLLPFVLHATAGGVMTWGWFSVLDLTKGQSITTQKGGHFQFLTIQGLAIAWLCMVVSLFRDIFPSVQVIRHLKRATLMISMPIALVISSMYWPVLLFSPHLVLGPIAGSHLPLPIDLVVHALPLFALLIDFFIFESKFSKTYHQKAAPTAAIVLCTWYASFVEYCARFNGSFPYPFLMHNPFVIRVMIYATAGRIALSCFRMLDALHA